VLLVTGVTDGSRQGDGQLGVVFTVGSSLGIHQKEQVLPQQVV
jgi:hypothetical protein